MVDGNQIKLLSSEIPDRMWKCPRLPWECWVDFGGSMASSESVLGARLKPTSVVIKDLHTQGWVGEGPIWLEYTRLHILVGLAEREPPVLRDLVNRGLEKLRESLRFREGTSFT